MSMLHRYAVKTLRRDVTPFDWRRPWRDRRTYQTVVMLGLGAAFALVSLGAIEGDVRRSKWGEKSIIVVPDVATWMPYAFDRVGYRTFANLREAYVSTKPATWTGLAERPPEKLDKTLMEKARAELAQVKPAPLRGADLRHADAVSTFLAKADLRGANLEGANLFGAKLQGADLEEAKLQGADLEEAKLQGADLTLAQLQRASLIDANLREADLTLAQLQRASLLDADLREADLRGANFGGAYLGGVNLQGANLGGADLQGADLSLANLTKAKNLTREQLDETCGDAKTTLPDYLADYQMKPCTTQAQSPSN